MLGEKPQFPDGTAAQGDPTYTLGFRSRSGDNADVAGASMERLREIGRNRGGANVIGDLELDPKSVWGATVESQRLSEAFNSRLESEERAYDNRIDAITKAGIKHNLINPRRVSAAPMLTGDEDAFGATYSGGSMAQMRDAGRGADAEFDRHIAELARDNPGHHDVIKPDRSVRNDDAPALRNAAVANAEDVYRRSQGTIGPKLAQFAGGLHGSIYDPVNVAALAAGPFGRVGTTAKELLWMATKTGAVNAGAAAVAQPAVQQWRAKAGIDAPALDYGLGLATENVATAFAFGFAADFGIRSIYRGVQHGVGRVPVLDKEGKVEGYKWRDDASSLRDNVAAAFRRSKLTPEQALDAAAKTAEPGSPLKKAADGDVDALAKLAKDAGLAEDPSIKGAIAAAKIEDNLKGKSPHLVDEGDGLSKLAQAIRNATDDSEPPPRAVDPVMPARARHENLSDDGPTPPSRFNLDGKPVSFQTVSAKDVGFDADTFQFKGGGNAQGVNSRLLGVDVWDPLAAGRTIIYERQGGGNGKPTAFKTAKGSTYDVQPDGTTIRNKALRSDVGHEGDQGIKPKSQRTVYVTAEDAIKLGEFQAQGAKRALGFTKKGQVAVKYLDGKDAGKFERRTAVSFQTEPKQGLTPVEIWNDGKNVHFGNEITEVSGGGGGQFIIADGHQRLALAKRLEDTGHEPINMQASIFREADGWTPGDVRAIAARKNLQEGSGNVIDAARALRERPDILDSSVPLTADAMRQARALARLSDDAFSEVVAGRVAPNHAAVVGDLVEAKAEHGAMVKALAEADPANVREARHIVADLMHGPKEHVQEIILGGHPNENLLAERAAVLDRALKLLKEDAGIFDLLSKEVERISGVGNRLAVDENAARVLQSDTIGALIETLASRPGPVREWLDDAARAVAGGRQAKAVAQEFADDVRKQIAAHGFEGLKPEPPPSLKGRGIDDPGGPEARQQVQELEEALESSIKGAMRKVADRNLDRWVEWQRLNKRDMAPINPIVRAEAVRLIAGGEDIKEAVRLARQNVEAEMAAKAEAKVLAEAERIENQTIAPEEVESVIGMWRHVEEMKHTDPPEGIASWLVRTGGIVDRDGDVRSMLGKANKRPGLISKKGATLDDAALRAWEEGFLTGTERPTINDLLDALDEDLRGHPIVRQVDQEVLDDIRLAREMENELAGYGLRGARDEAEVRARIDGTNQAVTGKTDDGRGATANWQAAYEAEVAKREGGVAGKGDGGVEDSAEGAGQDRPLAVRQQAPQPGQQIARREPENLLVEQIRQAYSIERDGDKTVAVLKSTRSKTHEDVIDVTQLVKLGMSPEEAVLRTIQAARGHGLEERSALAGIEDGQAQRRAFDSLGFYSALLETAKNKLPAKGTPEQMLGILRNTPGVKAGEITATKLDKFLARETGSPADAAKRPSSSEAGSSVEEGRSTSKAAKSVSRQEIVSFLESNRVEVREANYQGDGMPPIQLGEVAVENDGSGTIAVKLWNEEGRSVGSLFVGADGTIGSVSASNALNKFDGKPLSAVLGEHLAAQALAIKGTGGFDAHGITVEVAKVTSSAAGPARWSQYSLDPSNPTYRETVIHLGEPRRAQELEEQIKAIHAEQLVPGTRSVEDHHALMDKKAALIAELKDLNAQQFKQGHFSEPNVIAHARTSLQKDAQGKPVFLVDELQSDWGQKLRDGGARDEAKIADTEKRLQEATDKADAYLTSGPPLALLREAYPEMKLPDDASPARIQHWLSELARAPGKYGDLRETASEFRLAYDSLRSPVRLLQAELATAKSATPGHPLVSTTDQWTTTAFRRLIRQAVEAGADHIAIIPGKVAADRFNLAKQVDGLMYLPADPAANRIEQVAFRRPNGSWQYEPVNADRNSGKSLEEFVGKELAQKLREAPPAADDHGPMGWREIPDLGSVEIGGHGMKATYDAIYPRMLSKLLSKMDPSVKGWESKPLQSSMDGRTFRHAGDNRAQMEGQLAALERLSGKVSKGPQQPEILFHTFPLTDKVKASVLEDGQPMFAKAGDGSPGGVLKGPELADIAARSKIDKLVAAGRAYDVPPHVVDSGLVAVRAVTDLVPEDWQVGLASRVEPIGGGDVRVSFTRPDGIVFQVDRSWDATRNSRGITLPLIKTAILFRFDLIPNFGHSVGGEALHELTHIFYVTQVAGRLDGASRALLARHAESLRIMDMGRNEFFAKIGRRDLVTPGKAGTMRELYERQYSTSRNKAAKIAEESVAHMVELIHHGALKPADVSPILPILERVFGDRLTRRLKANDAAAKFVFAGPKALSADMAQLDRAQKMEAAGRAAMEIFETTSWFRDSNGAWAFQLPKEDVQFGMRPEKIAKGQFKTKFITGRAGDLAKAPRLFEAYPELADLSLNLQHRETAARGVSDLEAGTVDVIAGSEKQMHRHLLEQLQRFVNEIEQRPAAEPRAMAAIRKAADDIDREAAAALEKLATMEESVGKVTATDADRKAVLAQIEELRRARESLDEADWTVAWKAAENRKGLETGLPADAAKRPSESDIALFHGTPYGEDGFGAFDPSKTEVGVISFSTDRAVASDMLKRTAWGRKPPRGARGQGHVIEARLNVEPSRLIDAQKKLSEQSEPVKRALTQFLDENADSISPDAYTRGSGVLPDVDGWTFITWLRSIFDTEPSKALSTLGIPGYLSEYNGAPEYAIWDARVISRKGASEKEYPVHAAVAIGDKIVGRGVTHFDALQAAVPGAAERDLDGSALMKAFKAAHGTTASLDGFVTNKGRYVDRAEATKLAAAKFDDPYLGNRVFRAGALDAVAYDKYLKSKGIDAEANASRADGLPTAQPEGNVSRLDLSPEARKAATGDDWEANLFDEMARRSAVVETATERKAQKKAKPGAVLKEGEHDMVKEVAAFELAQRQAGKTATEVAEAIKSKYGYDVDPGQIARREVWWSINEALRMENAGPGDKWTPTAKAEFARLWNDGVPAQAISEVMTKMIGRPVSARNVSRQRGRQGLPSRPLEVRRTLSDEAMSHVVARLEARRDDPSITAQSIAADVQEKFGASVTPSYVRTLATKHGLTGGSNVLDWSPEAIATLTREDVAGLSLRQKAALLQASGMKVSRETVRKKLPELGGTKDDERFAVGPDDGSVDGMSKDRASIPKELEPLAERARQFKTAKEFMAKTSAISDPMKELDRIAFGVVDGEELTVNPKKLFVKHETDLDNAKSEKQIPYGPNAPPVDVSIQKIDGEIQWVIEDGHHRYWAALRDGKELKIKIESIRTNSYEPLGYKGFDDFMQAFHKQATSDAAPSAEPARARPDAPATPTARSLADDMEDAARTADLSELVKVCKA